MNETTVIIVVVGLVAVYFVMKSKSTPTTSPIATAAESFTTWWNKNYEWGFS